MISQPDPSFRPSRNEGDFERIRVRGVADQTTRFEGENRRVLTTAEYVGAGDFLVILDSRFNPVEMERRRAHLESITTGLDIGAFTSGGSYQAIENINVDPNTPDPSTPDPNTPDPNTLEPALAVVQVVCLALSHGYADGCEIYSSEDRGGITGLSKGRRAIILGPGDREDPYPALPDLSPRELEWLVQEPPRTQVQFSVIGKPLKTC